LSENEYRLVITGEAEVTKAPKPEPEPEPVQDTTDEGDS
jgi:hypothetical protein